MAERRGRRVIFFWPAQLSLEKRGRVTKLVPGSRSSTAPRMVLGAEQHGLVAATPVQQPVGEHVAALEVAGKLDLVDGEERHVDVGRHCFDRAHPVARLGRNDLFLPRHQRHVVVAGAQAHPVVDLARQQPERQADHAGGAPEHALDRQMRLARVGGPEDGGDVAGSSHEGGWHSLRGEGHGARCAVRMYGVGGACSSYRTYGEQTPSESGTRPFSRFVHEELAGNPVISTSYPHLVRGVFPARSRF
jgi:hypothetical protein